HASELRNRPRTRSPRDGKAAGDGPAEITARAGIGVAGLIVTKDRAILAAIDGPDVRPPPRAVPHVLTAWRQAKHIGQGPRFIETAGEETLPETTYRRARRTVTCIGERHRQRIVCYSASDVEVRTLSLCRITRTDEVRDFLAVQF